jgi:hypothetical protein
MGLQGDFLTPGVEDRAARPVYEAVGRDPDLACAAWSFAHGMTILELNRRFPPDAGLDAACEQGLAFRPSAMELKTLSARSGLHKTSSSPAAWWVASTSAPV